MLEKYSINREFYTINTKQNTQKCNSPKLLFNTPKRWRGHLGLNLGTMVDVQLPRIRVFQWLRLKYEGEPFRIAKLPSRTNNYETEAGPQWYHGLADIIALIIIEAIYFSLTCLLPLVDSYFTQLLRFLVITRFAWPRYEASITLQVPFNFNLFICLFKPTSTSQTTFSIQILHSPVKF